MFYNYEFVIFALLCSVFMTSAEDCLVDTKTEYCSITCSLIDDGKRDPGQVAVDYIIQNYKVLPTCNELFEGCYWLGRNAKCCNVFNLQRSESGYCYAFNSLTTERSKDCPPWEELEANDMDVESEGPMGEQCHMRKNTGAGTTTGLEVFLRPFSNESLLILDKRELTAAQVFIHHPSQFPDAGAYLYLPQVSGYVFTVKVSPAITVTNMAVRNLPPKERNCIFPDERQLTIYHTYTQQGCLIECRMNFLKIACGCSPYYFNLMYDDIPECTLSQLQCIANHSWDLRFFRPPLGTRGFSKASSMDCLHCLPTCHETVYDLESSSSKDNNPELRFSQGYLDVYYKDLGVVKYRRTLIFDKMQLIVSFGSIAGFFLGVSLLTVVELFYYLAKLIIAIFYKIISWRSKPRKSSELKSELQICHPLYKPYYQASVKKK